MAPAATIHDLYVWKLSKELRKRYDDVSTNVVLRQESRVAAEIDILAKRDGEVHVYEVKCSLRLTKARQQFRKISKYYSEDISKFFLYCGSSDSMLELAPQ